MEDNTKQYLCNTEGCPGDNFVSHGVTSTLVAWFPKRDSEGRLLNADPNTREDHYICSGCGARYIKKTRGWNTQYIMAKWLEVFSERDETPSYIERKEK